MLTSSFSTFLNWDVQLQNHYVFSTILHNIHNLYWFLSKWVLLFVFPNRCKACKPLNCLNCMTSAILSMTSSFFIVAKGNTADLVPTGIATVAKSLEIFVKKFYKTQITFFFFTIIQRILNKRSSYLAGYVEHIFRFTPKLIQVLYDTWANGRKTKMRLFCFYETTFVIFLATFSTQLRFASIFQLSN